jgi:glutaminyl-peptide cyclotransferase
MILKKLSRLAICPVLLTVMLPSCHNGQGTETKTKLAHPVVTLSSPTGGAHFKAGDSIKFTLSVADSVPVADSVELFVNQAKVNYTKSDKTLCWISSNSKLGQSSVSINYYAKGKKYTCQGVIYLLSKEAPVPLKYKIINVYKHDVDDYTQGLLVHKGILYESAGEYGKSSLRKYTFPGMKLLEKVATGDQYFAEGLAMYNDTLYQLTWKEQVCFVYSADELKLQRQIAYPIAEGWGLTYNGKEFIMSDGSSTLYFLNPASFKETHRINVCDNKKEVDQLNELEYVNGKIFANVYQTDNIVEIDPTTGKVTGILAMTGLLSKSDKGPNTDVLNGIALLPNGNLLVTGKNWPKLFEVKVSK